MRMFVRHIEKIHHDMIAMVGFTKKMENLINGNAKYVFNLCEEKYPGEHNEQQDNSKNSEAPTNVVPMSASVAADVNG